MRKILQHGNLVLPTQVLETTLIIEDGVIAYIGDDPSMKNEDQVVDLSGKYILPGFVDIHNHGAMGLDFSYGNYNPSIHSFEKQKDTFHQYLPAALNHYIKTGTTSVLLTTMAAPMDELLESMRLLHQFLETTTSCYNDLIAGINIEGSFVKMPVYAGAQNSAFFYSPDFLIVDRLQTASGNRIKIVNVPPEHGAKGLELIQQLKQQNITIAAGHSGAYADEVKRAVDAGLSLAVHFFNGPSRSATKPFFGGGAVEEMLVSNQISVELIADGYHIAPSYLRDIIHRKGIDRCIGITDSMFMNGFKKIKDFEMSGLRGCLSDNGKYLQLKDREDALFGSVLTMQKAFNNLLNWLSQSMSGVWYKTHIAHSLEQSLIQVSQMCSGNPAKQINIFESTKDTLGTGSLEEGKWADLLVVDLQNENGTYLLEIEQTYLKGEVLTSIEVLNK